MPIKTVLVRLRGDNGDLNRALLGSAAASKVLGHNLDDADDSARSLSDSLETSNDRTTMLVQSALALGPALVPLGAQAVPILAGITTQLGFAAAAAGVTALSFWGIGDALKAVNDYAIDPSDAHLKKMRETLNSLGPAGRDFVHFLQDLRPEMQQLQNLAQAGMLPGMEHGIDSLMERMPQVERVITSISNTLGSLSEDAGKSLAGPQWDEFFAFIQNEASPILEEFSRTTGNVLLGLANMVEAMGPMSMDFSTNLLNMSRDFVRWSDDLENSQGFQNFAEYVQNTGPEVWDTLGALATALLAIVEAAAPVGQASLPVITALSKVLTTIANSPAGPVLIGTAAGFSAVSRAVALYKIANGNALLGMITGAGKNGAKAGVGLRAAAIGVGMLALSMTNIDDQMGASHTAMGAMIGMLAGPWGAAVGGGIGLAFDFADANNDLEQAIRGADSAINAMDLEKMRSELTTLNDAIDATRDKLTVNANLGDNAAPFKISKENVSALIAGVNELATGSLGDAQAKLAELESTNEAVTLGVNALGREFGRFRTGTYITDLDKLNNVLERSQPAMEALGISTADLGKAVDDGSINQLVTKIVEYTRWAESAAGRTARIADAMAELDDEMISTEQSATDLKTALDALLDPNINLVRATDEWTTALRHLGDDLDKNNKTLRGNSDAAIKNREAINTRVEAMKQLLGAEADAGKSAGKMARDMRDQRNALIDAADAAGISRDEVRKYIDQLGLTPKLVRTLIEARTDQAAAALRRIQQQAQDVAGVYRIDFVVNQSNAFNKHTAMDAAGAGADGTTVHGPRYPYGDKMLYAVAPGEEIVSNRHGQADMNRAALKAANEGAKLAVVGWMADGGTAGRRYAQYPQPAPAGRSSAPTINLSPQSLAGLRIEGRLEVTQQGSYLRGVIRDEIAAEKRFDTVRAGGANG